MTGKESFTGVQLAQIEVYKGIYNDNPDKFFEEMYKLSRNSERGKNGLTENIIANEIGGVDLVKELGDYAKKQDDKARKGENFTPKPADPTIIKLKEDRGNCRILQKTYDGKNLDGVRELLDVEISRIDLEIGKIKHTNGEISNEKLNKLQNNYKDKEDLFKKHYPDGLDLDVNQKAKEVKGEKVDIKGKIIKIGDNTEKKIEEVPNKIGGFFSRLFKKNNQQNTNSNLNDTPSTSESSFNNLTSNTSSVTEQIKMLKQFAGFTVEEPINGISVDDTLKTKIEAYKKAAEIVSGDVKVLEKPTIGVAYNQPSLTTMNASITDKKPLTAQAGINIGSGKGIGFSYNVNANTDNFNLGKFNKFVTLQGNINTFNGSKYPWADVTTNIPGVAGVVGTQNYHFSTEVRNPLNFLSEKVLTKKVEEKDLPNLLGKINKNTSLYAEIKKTNYPALTEESKGVGLNYNLGKNSNIGLGYEHMNIDNNLDIRRFNGDAAKLTYKSHKDNFLGGQAGLYASASYGNFNQQKYGGKVAVENVEYISAEGAAKFTSNKFDLTAATRLDRYNIGKESYNKNNGFGYYGNASADVNYYLNGRGGKTAIHGGLNILTNQWQANSYLGFTHAFEKFKFNTTASYGNNTSIWNPFDQSGKAIGLNVGMETVKGLGVNLGIQKALDENVQNNFNIGISKRFFNGNNLGNHK